MNKINILSTNAARAFLDELLPAFSREHGIQVAITYHATQQILARIQDDAHSDMVIATASGINELAKFGKIVVGSRTELGSTKIGIGVRAGATKPDIRSVDAFQRALLAAPSIAYTVHGQSGIHFTRVVQRLGLTDQLKPKFKIIPGGLVGEIVLRGEAELGVQMLSEILAIPGFELVGPLPAELNEVTTFAAALQSGTTEADAASACMRFLTTREAHAAMQRKGFETP